MRAVIKPYIMLTETYAKSFFEEDIARFKIVLAKIKEIQDKRDKIFNLQSVFPLNLN